MAKPSEVDGMVPTQMSPFRTGAGVLAVAGNVGSQQSSAKSLPEIDLQQRRALFQGPPLGTVQIQ